METMEVVQIIQFVALVLLIIIVFRLLGIIAIKNAQGRASSNGWIEFSVNSEVRIVVYRPSVYWDAHRDIPEQNILEKGDFEIQQLSWFTYCPNMTKDEFEVFLFKNAKKCGCGNCRVYVDKYLAENGEPEN